MEQSTHNSTIRRLRHARGLSAVRLASQVGLTENALRKLESGRSREPRFSTGLRLAEALHVPPHQLAGIEGAGWSAGPELGAVIRNLRGHKGALGKLRIEHVAVFGSVARGDAHSGSDIDIVVTPQPHGPFTLINLAAASDLLEAALRGKVDVITLKTLQSAPYGDAALEEAVRVF